MSALAGLPRNECELLRVDVRGVDRALFADGIGEEIGEVSTAGTEVCDGAAWYNRQLPQDFLRTALRCGRAFIEVTRASQGRARKGLQHPDQRADGGGEPGKPGKTAVLPATVRVG